MTLLQIQSNNSFRYWQKTVIRLWTPTCAVFIYTICLSNSESSFERNCQEVVSQVLLRESTSINITKMITTIFILAMIVGVQSNNSSCFGLCEYSHLKSTDVGILPLTNYQCILKCATIITKEINEYFDHCVWLDNLIYCMEMWKKYYEVDCHEPMKNVVQNKKNQRLKPPQCFIDYINGTYVTYPIDWA